MDKKEIPAGFRTEYRKLEALSDLQCELMERILSELILIRNMLEVKVEIKDVPFTKSTGKPRGRPPKEKKEGE